MCTNVNHLNAVVVAAAVGATKIISAESHENNFIFISAPI
jgi:hypothetical protein